VPLACSRAQHTAQHVLLQLCRQAQGALSLLPLLHMFAVPDPSASCCCRHSQLCFFLLQIKLLTKAPPPMLLIFPLCLCVAHKLLCLC
jgi:hypothetical protein